MFFSLFFGVSQALSSVVWCCCCDANFRKQTQQCDKRWMGFECWSKLMNYFYWLNWSLYVIAVIIVHDNFNTCRKYEEVNFFAEIHIPGSASLGCLWTGSARLQSNRDLGSTRPKIAIKLRLADLEKGLFFVKVAGSYLGSMINDHFQHIFSTHLIFLTLRVCWFS